MFYSLFQSAEVKTNKSKETVWITQIIIIIIIIIIIVIIIIKINELESIQLSFAEAHSYPKLFYYYRGALKIIHLFMRRRKHTVVMHHDEDT